MLSYFEIQIRKSFLGRLSWLLASKIKCEHWKCPIFDVSQLSCPTTYQKILWACSFACKNLLNFSNFTKKFHNCHHVSMHTITKEFEPRLYVIIRSCINDAKTKSFWSKSLLLYLIKAQCLSTRMWEAIANFAEPRYKTNIDKSWY